MKLSLKLRPCLWDGLVVAVIVAAIVGLGGYYWQLGHAGGALTAVVRVDGAEHAAIHLSALTEPEERVIVGNGYTLHLVVTPEGVTMDSADCPTQDCVHTGTIRRGGQSIVCLPARVAVTLQGERGGVDVVIG